jgi:hypothetical protein
MTELLREIFDQLTDDVLSPKDFPVAFYGVYGYLPLFEIENPIDFEEFIGLITHDPTETILSRRNRFQAMDRSCKGYLDDRDLLLLTKNKYALVIAKRNLFPSRIMFHQFK